MLFATLLTVAHQVLLSMDSPGKNTGEYFSKSSKFNPCVEKIPGGRHGNLLQQPCLENPHGQRSLEGYSSWGRKESDMHEYERDVFHFFYNRGPSVMWALKPRQTME